MIIIHYLLKVIINILKILFIDSKVFINIIVSVPKGRKFGSPVRIFTNIPLNKLILPSNEGYRYCDICEYWVSEENQHCPQCNKCTSKVKYLKFFIISLNLVHRKVFVCVYNLFGREFLKNVCTNVYWSP